MTFLPKLTFNPPLVFPSSPGLSSCQPLVKCKRVFQALINIAVEELCEVASSLIAPVRLGAARPTAPFSLVSANIEAVQVRIFMLFNVLLCYVMTYPRPTAPFSLVSANIEAVQVRIFMLFNVLLCYVMTYPRPTAPFSLVSANIEAVQVRSHKLCNVSLACKVAVGQYVATSYVMLALLVRWLSANIIPQVTGFYEMLEASN